MVIDSSSRLCLSRGAWPSHPDFWATLQDIKRARGVQLACVFLVVQMDHEIKKTYLGHRYVSLRFHPIVIPRSGSVELHLL